MGELSVNHLLGIKYITKEDVDLIFEKDNSKKWLNAIENSFIRL